MHGRADQKIQLAILAAVVAALLGALAPTGLSSGGNAANLAGSPLSDSGAPSITADVAPATVPEAAAAPKGVISPAFWAAAPIPKASAANTPQVNGLSAVVIDEASGEVLFDKNAQQPLPPASLTKIATLILALEYGRSDEEVISDVDGFSMRGSTIMGLEVGDRFSLRDLIFGMMLPSGNDAALVIGRHVAGTDAAFVAMMNNLAQSLGLAETHFVNPHGLGGGGQQLSSAYDLAILSRYGMSLPSFREIVTTGSWTARGSRTIRLNNINNFLYSYPGADGIKTGYTRGAGPTLAAAATRDGHRLYAIVLNSPSRESDAQRLLNWAFASFSWPQP